MVNKLSTALTGERLVCPGDAVTCAVSGGADSIALLFGMYLLKEKLQIELHAAHFNHHLRGAESDADEAFVVGFCADYHIPLRVGGAQVQPGKKGLEAAARDARYEFLRSLPGKVATAHTADDNAETLLMHILRGTGLKGLGGICSNDGKVIRPMLNITRYEVEAFLREYSLPHREDSSNASDDFLRNRVRHNIMPLLRQENPNISLSMSAMAGKLRQDEEYLQSLLEPEMPPVSRLRGMPVALQRRYAERMLKQSGVREPEQTHIQSILNLIAADRPSAKMNFPGNVTIARDYDRLIRLENQTEPDAAAIKVPGVYDLPQWGISLRADIVPNGGIGVTAGKNLCVRSRRKGDTLRLNGGTKSLKKRMIDCKISASTRSRIPILADDGGVIWAGQFGFHLDRLSAEPNCYLVIEPIHSILGE